MQVHDEILMEDETVEVKGMKRKQTQPQTAADPDPNKEKRIHKPARTAVRGKNREAPKVQKGIPVLPL